MDSTAHLVGANASYVELSLQRLPAGQSHMQEDNPVSRHRKSEMGLVLARPGFRCFLKHGGHTRVRHVCFHGDARSGNGPRRSVGQLDNHRSRADRGRFGRDCVLNRNCRRRIARPGTPGHEQSGYAREQQNA